MAPKRAGSNAPATAAEVESRALTARVRQNTLESQEHQPVFTPFSGRTIRLAALVFVATLGHANAWAQDRGDPASFRVFLRDGTAVVSYGEFVRVNDRLVFSMPVDGAGAELQVVNLPIASVDLDKTEQYSVAVRAARYAAGAGEADYAALTAQVATALNRIASSNEPLERLQIAEQMRGIVATWGRDHYAFRASDVRQIRNLLDETVSDLRAEAGINQFDLNLVAGVEPPSTVLLPRPTPADAIEQVLRVAGATDVAADRVALMRAVARRLQQPVAGRDAGWVKRMRQTATEAIAAELRTDLAYRELSHATLTRALAAASHADVEGVEDLLGDIHKRDARLGRKRPDEVAGLVAAVERHLDAARRLRLARDHWRLQYQALRNYEDLARPALAQIGREGRRLEAIRRLAGPDPAALQRLSERLARTSDLIARISPPPDVAAVHATLASACQLAVRSVATRRQAVETGDLQLAWDASSAAAGAMMLLARARDGLAAALRPPELQ